MIFFDTCQLADPTSVTCTQNGGKIDMNSDQKQRKIPVNIRHLEQDYGVDLHEFKPGVTYPLAKLMDALGFMKPGRSKVTRRRDKN